MGAKGGDLMSIKTIREEKGFSQEDVPGHCMCPCSPTVDGNVVILCLEQSLFYP